MPSPYQALEDSKGLSPWLFGWVFLCNALGFVALMVSGGCMLCTSDGFELTNLAQAPFSAWAYHISK
jgi:hypothetical protein